MSPVNVTPQPTPNPNSVKFTLDRPVVVGDSKSYFSPEEADTPLAKMLFEVEGVAGLFFLNNFITVTKSPDADWNTVVPDVEERIKKYFSG
ncbi:MAG TPA: NifU N-terminal domain-containing protein [Sphingobacteriaceae bacterium]|nr:NifU N-terminal domain-containing protein [Sphingobacteriaceae bacterium]